MAYFETTIETAAPIADAFDYLADFSNAAEWDPSVVAAERLGKGAIKVGARFRVELGLGPRRVPFEYTLERREKNRLLIFRADAPGLRSLDTITFEATGSGTRVRYDADLRLEGMGFLLDPVLHLGFQVSGRRSAAGLRKALAALSSVRSAGGARASRVPSAAPA